MQFFSSELRSTLLVAYWPVINIYVTPFVSKEYKITKSSWITHFYLIMFTCFTTFSFLDLSSFLERELTQRKYLNDHLFGNLLSRITIYFCSFARFVGKNLWMILFFQFVYLMIAFTEMKQDLPSEAIKCRNDIFNALHLNSCIQWRIQGILYWAQNIWTNMLIPGDEIKCTRSLTNKPFMS